MHLSGHEEVIAKILSANTKLVNDRMDSMNRKIDDLQTSLEYTEKELSEEVMTVEQQQNKVKEERDDVHA